MINNKETEDVNHLFEPKEEILALNMSFLTENAKTSSLFTPNFFQFPFQLFPNILGPNEQKSLQNDNFKEELFKDLNEIVKINQDRLELWKKE